MQPLDGVGRVQRVGRVKARGLAADAVREAEGPRRGQLHTPADVPHHDVGSQQRTLGPRLDLIPDLHILPVARLGATARLRRVDGIDLRELFRGVGLLLQLLLGALLGGVPLRVDPGATPYGVHLAFAVGVEVVMGDVCGATAEAALLLDHTDLRLQHAAPVAQCERPPPLKLHDGLVRAEAGEGVALKHGLGLRVRPGRGVLAHGVEERRRRDQGPPAGARSVGRVAVERVVVPVPEGEVARRVPGHLVVVRRVVLRLRHPQTLARLLQCSLGEHTEGGLPSGLGRGHVEPLLASAIRSWNTI